ncbi:hypothetical protein IM816_14130 [Luteibacter flocculans]|uniref:Ig-like domain-containing protein n=1 Tax=Luteibacter flocculans TaxID=2780091 RepID=A0ABY4SYF7_9GAMM|nr:hypothetical protein [Luteibacter flocculans]URL57746.1 hypothetical protein IM816_14130 [Luteibacter flocculans]
MKQALVRTVLLAVSVFAGALPTHAAEGHLGFQGAITEVTCRADGARLACPQGRSIPTNVRWFHTGTAAGLDHTALFAYARQRDASTSWRIMEITYR